MTTNEQLRRESQEIARYRTAYGKLRENPGEPVVFKLKCEGIRTRLINHIGNLVLGCKKDFYIRFAGVYSRFDVTLYKGDRSVDLADSGKTFRLESVLIDDFGSLLFSFEDSAWCFHEGMSLDGLFRVALMMDSILDLNDVYVVQVEVLDSDGNVTESAEIENYDTFDEAILFAETYLKKPGLGPYERILITACPHHGDDIDYTRGEIAWSSLVKIE